MSNQSTFDVIVIGAGHNGLSAGATLARKGKSVCVIEKADMPGGMARASHLGGEEVPEMAHLLYNLNTTVARELGLQHLMDAPALPSVSLSPDGNHVVLRGGDAKRSDGSAHPEAVAFATLHDRLVRFAGLLGQMSIKPPPSLEGGLASLAALGDIGGLAKLGLDLKRLGKSDMREFLRVLLSNAYDLLLDELDDGPLAGIMAADAVRGAYAGPRSPGTVFSLMYRLGNGGQPRLPKGGMGAVADAFSAAARLAGCDIRCGRGVRRILVENDQATGVELEDGSVLTARAVLSSVAPMPTMMMTGVAEFDVEATRRVRNIRAKGTAAKLNLILRGLPEFTGLPPNLIGARLVVAPSADYVERAFNPAKYGELPTSPMIEAVIPTASEETRATHTLSAIISFVPHTPDGGWTDASQAALVDTVLATLEAYAPGLRSLVVETQLLTPSDIEARTGAPGGHWHHAEMGIDQVLTVRPANQMAHYKFGVQGLYLCGASAHPGGDITGVPGRNSALRLLKDGIAG